MHLRPKDFTCCCLTSYTACRRILYLGSSLHPWGSSPSASPLGTREDGSGSSSYEGPRRIRGRGVAWGNPILTCQLACYSRLFCLIDMDLWHPLGEHRDRNLGDNPCCSSPGTAGRSSSAEADQIAATFPCSLVSSNFCNRCIHFDHLMSHSASEYSRYVIKLSSSGGRKRCWTFPTSLGREVSFAFQTCGTSLRHRSRFSDHGSSPLWIGHQPCLFYRNLGRIHLCNLGLHNSALNSGGSPCRRTYLPKCLSRFSRKPSLLACRRAPCKTSLRCNSFSLEVLATACHCSIPLLLSECPAYLRLVLTRFLSLSEGRVQPSFIPQSTPASPFAP